MVLGLKLECHAVTGWKREAESVGVSEPSEIDTSVRAF